MAPSNQINFIHFTTPKIYKKKNHKQGRGNKINTDKNHSSRKNIINAIENYNINHFSLKGGKDIW